MNVLLNLVKIMDVAMIKSMGTNVYAILALLEHFVKLILTNVLAIHAKSLAHVMILLTVITVAVKLVILAVIVD